MNMFFLKPKVKNKKEIKINNNIKKIYFTYNEHEYLYIKESENDSYLINIFIENDGLSKSPIYTEQKDGKDIIVERNYFLIGDDFYKQLQNQKLISNKYKISKNRIVNKLEYFYENFKDIDNVPILQCTFGETDYDHYFYDNRLKYFFKLNGKSYRLIREIEDLVENILNEYDVTIPIINIEELVEKLGGKVVYDNLNFDYSCIEKIDDKSFLIKINTNDYFFTKHYGDENYIKRIIADELGNLFIYMGYQLDNELWKSFSTKKEYHMGYGRRQNFHYSLLMPKNIFTQIIKKYEDENHMINTQDVADYFNVWRADVINRGEMLGFFHI